MSRELVTAEALAQLYGNERYNMMMAVLERAGINTKSAKSQETITSLALLADNIKSAANAVGYKYGDVPAMVGGNADFKIALDRMGLKLLDQLSPATGQQTEGDKELRNQRARDLALNLLKTLVVDAKSSDYQTWKSDLIKDPKKPNSTSTSKLI
ncbi:hypothetical protein KBD71_02380 [Candidatus Woesebacteria bacterium]|nr:hypothetical protein [Candidatus Woesebacteria bacterium]